MGFLGRPFKKQNPPAIDALQVSIDQLRLGLFVRLLAKYRSLIGEQQGRFLAAAIINTAIVEDPANPEATEYKAKNMALIQEEAEKLNLNDEFAEALSYLYAAESIVLTYRAKDRASERAKQIVHRASELSLHIPNTYDICGSDDFSQCVLAIAEYATAFVKTSPK